MARGGPRTPFTFFIKMYERRGGLRTPDPKTLVHSIVHDTYNAN